MGKRHETIGIKQTIRIGWMQKTANLLLAGLDAKAVRQELHDFLSGRKGSGSEGKRGSTSRSQVVNMLMKIWVTPEHELLSFRDAALVYLRKHPSMVIPVHWAMISAAYPFWFSVAKQTGRVLALQDRVAKSQIVNRLKEQYGDRDTISRYARYVLRSFVAWETLMDSDRKGCYEKAPTINVNDSDLLILMIESALHALPESKASLGLLLNHPAFFPFQNLSVSGDFVALHSDRINVNRYGLDDEILKLKRA